MSASEEVTQELSARVLEGASDPDEAFEEHKAKPTGNLSDPKRLYISNVSYQTTEEDLKELLEEFEVLSVLIPSQTIRGFRSAYQKSLGVAYAEFKTELEASLAREKLNGVKLHNREIRVKPYIPYSAVSRSSSVKRSRSKQGRGHGPFSRSQYKESVDKNDDIAEATEPKGDDDTDGVKNHSSGETDSSQSVKIGNENTDTDQSPVDGSSKESENSQNEEPGKAVSQDTVFIGRLSPKVTDGDLREFFYDYGPTDVFIFKSYYGNGKGKGKPFHFHQRRISALITLNAKDGVKDSTEHLSNKKLKNKTVIVRAAYLSKIEEVKKAAEQRLKKLESSDASKPETAHDDGDGEKDEHEDEQVPKSVKSNSITEGTHGGEEEEHQDLINVVKDTDESSPSKIPELHTAH